MRNHLVFSSSAEQIVLAYDTDQDPPYVGDFVPLLFGDHNELCRYRVVDLRFIVEGEDSVTFYIEVSPA